MKSNSLRNKKIVVVIAFFITLSYLTLSVLDFKYQKTILPPTIINIIMIIIGQLVPLIMFIICSYNSDMQSKTEKKVNAFLLYFAHSNFSLNSLRPFYYVKFNKLTILDSYLEYLKSPFIFLIIIISFLIYAKYSEKKPRKC